MESRVPQLEIAPQTQAREGYSAMWQVVAVRQLYKRDRRGAASIAELSVQAGRGHGAQAVSTQTR